MAKQEIQYIDIKDLVLWTENPRDPFDSTATDQDIAERAISKDKRSKWSLEKLFELMRGSYDYSEIPTVAYVKGNPVVFDGNRRVLIGKIIHGCVDIETKIKSSQFDFPKKVPCNVCDKTTAINHVDRKHADNGTWGELERDIFKHTHMNCEKSEFLVIEDATGIISKNSFMNKRFVKEEVISVKNLNDLGILVEGGVLKTPYTPKELTEIFWTITDLVKSKEITTRKNRGELKAPLEKHKSVKDIISKNKGKPPKPYKGPQFVRLTPYVKPKIIPLFGEQLNLEPSIANNLCRDLTKLHTEIGRDDRSPNFSMIVRMGLRLLCEVAAIESAKKIHKSKKYPPKKETTLEYYIEKYFEDTKQGRDKDDREFFDTHVPDTNTMIRLLQKAAHPASETLSDKQTIALSIILGKIIEKTLGTDT